MTFVFDAYGTLFQVMINRETLRKQVGDRAEKLLEIWRRKTLEFTWLHNAMGTYLPFDRVSEDALDIAMYIMAVKNDQVRKILLPVYRSPVAFEDVTTALSTLKNSKAQLMILSNGTVGSLKAGVDHAGIDELIDEICSVDLVKVFKPDPRVYALVREKSTSAEAETFFVSGNAWDIAGAANYGMRTVWLNRGGGVFGSLGPGPEHVISSLKELEDFTSGI